MQYLRVASYKITKGTFPEIIDTAKEGMLRTFKAQPGFIRYGIADTGDGTCLSLSLWETRTQAEAAAPVAAFHRRLRRWHPIALLREPLETRNVHSLGVPPKRH